MNEDLEKKRIFLLGGPGGVGKTTLAASLGVKLAQRGYRTIVLTVDPARRLAQAMGLLSFEKEIQEIAVPGQHAGRLYATMLDTQRYFDKVIERFASSEQQKQRIFANPLYRTGTAHLGGTHEYAAMERLFEFSQDNQFEKIVVDTPPSQNAVDLLKAPQRLSDFMDVSVLRWFLGPSPAYLRLIHRSTRLAMKFIEHVFGSDFLSTFSNFLEDLYGMHEGFRQRNLEVIRLLQSQETAFWLVTYPSEGRYLESLSFLKTLKERRIPLGALVLNRVEPSWPQKVEEKHLDPESRRRIDLILDYYRRLCLAQSPWIEQFEEAFPNLPHYQIPRQPQDIHDLSGLARLGDFLTGKDGAQE